MNIFLLVVKDSTRKQTTSDIITVRFRRAWSQGKQNSGFKLERQT